MSLSRLVDQSVEVPLSDLAFTAVSTTYVSYTPSLAGPDLPGEGRSGHYCQHSVDDVNP